jgi:SAM-dependent methyltransferase
MGEVSAMERAEWLKKIRIMAERLYDHGAPAYWVNWGLYPDPTHREFIEKFLSSLRQLNGQCELLDAACGAGRYDGMLLEAGHTVLGIDQSGGVLARAREHFPLEHFPRLRYAKLGLQEMDFQAAFDGIICMDAMEHICPEDWPGIVERFHRALKPGGLLYVTVDALKLPEDAEAYERAKAMGLPVVFGEIGDEYAHLLARKNS